jgi:hypothetical protein
MNEMIFEQLDENSRVDILIRFAKKKKLGLLTYNHFVQMKENFHELWKR